jgi:hypothetical protein
VINFVVNKFDGCGGGITAQGEGTSGKGRIIFLCFRHRVYAPSKKKTQNLQNTSTAKPQNKEENCRWRFTLYVENKGSILDNCVLTCISIDCIAFVMTTLGRRRLPIDSRCERPGKRCKGA